jgi:hypothetical protein
VACCTQYCTQGACMVLCCNAKGTARDSLRKPCRSYPACIACAAVRFRRLLSQVTLLHCYKRGVGHVI